MNTTENNRLIAEFMGARFISDGINAPKSNDIFIPFHGSCRTDTIELGKGKIIKYHSSWDWLMEVVEKIESLGFKVNSFGKNEDDGSYYTIVYSSIEGSISLVNEIGLDRFEALYKAVVEFIKWYNKIDFSK